MKLCLYVYIKSPFPKQVHCTTANSILSSWYTIIENADRYRLLTLSHNRRILNHFLNTFQVHSSLDKDTYKLYDLQHVRSVAVLQAARHNHQTPAFLFQVFCVFILWPIDHYCSLLFFPKWYGSTWADASTHLYSPIYSVYSPNGRANTMFSLGFRLQLLLHFTSLQIIFHRRRMLRELHVGVQFIRVHWRLLFKRSLLLPHAADLRRRSVSATVHLLSTAVVNIHLQHLSEHRRFLLWRLLLLHAIRLQRLFGQRTMLQKGKCQVYSQSISIAV